MALDFVPSDLTFLRTYLLEDKSQQMDRDFNYRDLDRGIIERRKRNKYYSTNNNLFFR